MSWDVRAKASLQPLSIEKNQLFEMLKEWYYTGNANDLGEPCESCQLCQHEPIRYQFEIANGHTGNVLLIGSECITRFEIPALDEQGNPLGKDETRIIVQRDRNKLIQEATAKRVIHYLIQLLAKDTDFKIESFIDYYQERGAFTPNQLSMLLWRLDQNKIDYKKSDLKLIIKRGREQDQLLKMPDWKFGKLLECLSPSQLDWVFKNRLNAQITKKK